MNLGKYRQVFVPFLVLLLCFSLFLFGGKFLLVRINQLRVGIQNSQKEIRVLERNLEILQETQGSIEKFSSPLVLALPQSNSSLLGLSQLRAVFGSRGVFLSNIGVGASVEGGAGVQKNIVSLDADGAIESILSAFEALNKSMPISRLEKVKIVSSEDVARSSFSVAFFWAPFPAKLPSLTQETKQLSAAELDFLEELSGYAKPPLNETGVAVPAISGARSDPFLSILGGVGPQATVQEASPSAGEQ